MPYRASVLMLVTFLMGCAQSDGDIKTVFGNAQAIETVRNATSVTAYRLDSYPQETFRDYEMTSPPVDVPDELSAEIRELLLDQDSYLWDLAKGCEPLYGVRIQFLQGEDAVDVLFCFECDILTVYHNGQRAGGEDFDNIRDELVENVQQLFPEDDAIQSLK